MEEEALKTETYETISSVPSVLFFPSWVQVTREDYLTTPVRNPEPFRNQFWPVSPSLFQGRVHWVQCASRVFGEKAALFVLSFSLSLSLPLSLSFLLSLSPSLSLSLSRSLAYPCNKRSHWPWHSSCTFAMLIAYPRCLSLLKWWKIYFRTLW